MIPSIAAPGDISPELCERIVAEQILPAVLDGAVAQERPVAVWVCGQPGSGKTTLARQVHASLGRRGGVVLVASDQLKRHHPLYGSLLQTDDLTAGQQARIQGDFPTALEMAQHLGWEGRRHRVEGDIWWADGDFTRAAGAFRAARNEAEQHRVQGEAATSQALRALVLGFADPDRAPGEIELAQQLLRPLVLRASGFNAALATLAAQAGSAPTEQGDIPGQIANIRAQIQAAGLDPLTAQADMVLVLHHAIRGDRTAAAEQVERSSSRPRPAATMPHRRVPRRPATARRSPACALARPSGQSPRSLEPTRGPAPHLLIDLPSSSGAADGYGAW